MASRGGQVADLIGQTIISYVRRAGGEGAVARVLELAGAEGWCDHTPAGFIGGADTVVLCEAAAQVCGDPDLPRRVGEENFRINAANGLNDFLRACPGPAEALSQCVETANKMSLTKRHRVIEVRADGVLIEACTVAGYRPHRLSCGMACGYWSQVPGLFGAVGTAIESECELRGDSRCLIRVSWSGGEEPGRSATEREAAARRAAGAIDRFERLQNMASELAMAGSVETALEGLLQQAATTVVAPQFLLAVQMADHEERRVHAFGMAQDVADELARRLSAPGAVGADEECVVAVRSARRQYGILACFLPAGTQVSPLERRLLTAYAGYAAGVLDSARALEDARRERDAARALLELSEALGRGGAPAEVAERLVHAVPRVTGADQAGYWSLLGADGGPRLELVAAGGRGEVAPAALPDLSGLLGHPGPYLLDVRHLPPGPVASSLRARGVQVSALTPVGVRDRLFGVLVAEFKDGSPAAGPDLPARLHAVAEHGARALDNAELLEQVRHQALHDPLTGLANRALAQEMGAHQLSRCQREGTKPAVLFVDLDQLKAINDRLGHACGDELLVEVASRLVASVRESDHVARLSGDEFVIIVPDCPSLEEAGQVARRILAGFDRPVEVGSHRLIVSASVGVALYPDHGRDFEELVARADAAMYQAKSAGRGTWSYLPLAEAGPRG